MDTETITAAITGALGKLSSTVVNDSYSALKSLIVKKWGASSNLAVALEEAERSPTSNARRGVLHEELASVKAHDQSDIVTAANKLNEVVSTAPHGAQTVTLVRQNISGKGHTVVGTGTINIRRG